MTSVPGEAALAGVSCGPRREPWDERSPHRLTPGRGDIRPELTPRAKSAALMQSLRGLKVLMAETFPHCCRRGPHDYAHCAGFQRAMATQVNAQTANAGAYNAGTEPPAPRAELIGKLPEHRT